MKNLKAENIFNFNSTIAGVTNNKESIGIIVVYFVALSVIFEFLCLVVVIKAKKILIKLEFYLIISICVSTIMIKINTVFFIFILFKNVLAMPQFLCIFLYSLGSFLSFTFFVLLYYSLFHITILNRTKTFVKLNDFLRKPKTFLTFLFITLISTFTVSLTFFIISKDKIYSKLFQNYHCLSFFIDKSFSKLVVLINVYNILPASLTNIIYIASQFLILSSYCKKSGTEKNDKRRKNLHRIILKFFFFSIFSDILIILFLFCFFDDFESFFFMLTAVLFLIFISIESIFLILIHNILRKELLKLFKTLGNSLLKILFE